MSKKTILIGLGLSVATLLMAKPNLPMGDLKAKLSQVAGEPGMFVRGKENFPKDYFLVPKNLPFLVGLTLFHPESSTLGLSKEQIDKIVAIKNKTVPMVVKTAKDIKMLELKLAQNIAIDNQSPEAQDEIVDAISKLRTELTKAHLRCIRAVRDILTKEQYEKLLKYATRKGGK
ncbi:hypothetical protein [Nitratifractor sp.]|uniref:hypothetical protein n=1 Tax=Nitratifractor sp. TaxID=2268144 RepID=UPI0025F23064|nr:hypothetical protein [Nitratifractor sp.]